jgi:thiosulfate/3-mercaptopyruvate sulfurtransferase
MMAYANPEALVSTQWLADHLNDADLCVVDATYYFVGQKKGIDDYTNRHIPGAVFWDLAAIADMNSTLGVMLPPPDQFAAAMTGFGISNATRVVVYDATALIGAARVWWHLRAMGHDQVSVLDGGLTKWLSEGRPTESGPPTRKAAAGRFTPKPRPELVRDFDAMLKNLTSRNDLVVDARAAGRFKGLEPETRPGSRPGHIPASVNVAYGQILQGEHKTFAPGDEIAAKFKASGADPDGKIAVSCGSGISAPVLALGLYLLGNKNVAVYDGSWNEWGTRADAPIER